MQGEELLQAYASADVFMMPSESETLGFVVLEAMASGLPVVAVAAGGLTDILTEPGETGAHTLLFTVFLINLHFYARSLSCHPQPNARSPHANVCMCHAARLQVPQLQLFERRHNVPASVMPLAA